MNEAYLAPLRAVTLAMVACAATLNSAHASSNYLPPRQVAKLVREYFPDAPIMVRVAACESGLQQTHPDGTLVKSAANAVGVMQIHMPAHRDTARRKGIDLKTIRGNLKMARELYDEDGLRPWEPSRSCWSNAARAQHTVQQALASEDL